MGLNLHEGSKQKTLATWCARMNWKHSSWLQHEEMGVFFPNINTE
jgi:hypothetical protein